MKTGPWVPHLDSQFLHAIHSVSRYFLNIYCVPGTSGGLGIRREKAGDGPSSQGQCVITGGHAVDLLEGTSCT